MQLNQLFKFGVFMKSKFKVTMVLVSGLLLGIIAEAAPANFRPYRQEAAQEEAAAWEKIEQNSRNAVSPFGPNAILKEILMEDYSNSCEVDALDETFISSNTVPIGKTIKRVDGLDLSVESNISGLGNHDWILLTHPHFNSKFLYAGSYGLRSLQSNPQEDSYSTAKDICKLIGYELPKKISFQISKCGLNGENFVKIIEESGEFYAQMHRNTSVPTREISTTTKDGYYDYSTNMFVNPERIRNLERIVPRKFVSIICKKKNSP
jgi:hypothetical protein